MLLFLWYNYLEVINLSIYVAKRGKRIGKTIMGSLYIHKSAISNLTEDEFHLYKTKLDCISELEFEFDVIKINFKDCEVSFIQSPDWDSANEPTVGDSICVKRDNSIRKTNGSNLIYHHKWMFVDDSYSGFSVSESKLR